MAILGDPHSRRRSAQGINRTRGQYGALVADGNHTEDALSNLEFMVSIDPYLNETTRF